MLLTSFASLFQPGRRALSAPSTRGVALLGALAAFLALGAPGVLSAQQAATVQGQVTDGNGNPLAGAQVSVSTIQVGTLTGNDGNYSLTIPAARLDGESTFTLQARLIGYSAGSAQITVSPGARVTQNFQLTLSPLQLEELVAVGQGVRTERRRIGTTINTVDVEDVVNSQETNIVNALAGKAPNVEVTSSGGEPGAGSYIRIRGANTLSGGNQPIFVVDGTIISNTTNSPEANIWGTANQNRAADLNPNDIASIEILKGPTASAIYGAAGANGAVIIETKSGSRQAPTQLTLKGTLGFDEISETPPLQRGFGQGLVLPSDPNTDLSPTTSVTWGEPLSGTTYDHSDEVFDTGLRYSGDATLSGGGEGTTYFLSGGWTSNDSYFKGPNSELDKLNVRLKGSQDLMDNLTVTGNFAYTKNEGGLIQQGSNTSGIMLGAWRTPPDYDNCPTSPTADPPCYIDPETGYHRSYRNPNPTSLASSRGYDNPFWVAYEMPNTTDVDRTFGNVRADWDPLEWLNVQYTLGADYYTDKRLTVIPKSSSDFPDGRMIRADLTEFAVDHSLLVTATRDLTDDISGSLTLGQNLRHSEYSRFQVDGLNLIFGTEELDFAVQRVPDEYKQTIRTAGYFANANIDMYDQLFLTGGVRFDANSTFGGEDAVYYAFPNASAAWEFTQLPAFEDLGWLSYGKLHAAFGIAGKEPPVYSNVSSFTTGTISDGWLATGLETIYFGSEGVVSEIAAGNEDIEPERTREFDVGVDLAFLNERLSVGLTYYDQETTDAILFLPTAPETGFGSRPQNGAEYKNWGWEATLDATPVNMDGLRWDLGLQWGKNDSEVVDLLTGENFFLAGFTTGQTAVMYNLCGATADQPCPFGAHFGDDYVRFGRDINVGGVNIDEAYSGWNAGDLYIGEDGLPRYDSRFRALGDPSPDWTGSVRSTFTFFDNLRVSGLLDISEGGQMWNGTKGALVYFGTHAFSEPMHGAGAQHVFGCTESPAGNGPADGNYAVCSSPTGVAGPGVGTEVNLNWNSWVLNNIGSGFTGPTAQFIEDASYVKLRDISLSYTFDQDWVSKIWGASRIEVQATGRNLKTWTDYSGIDPESNLVGQDTGRGLDYFNNPQARSFVFTVSFVR